MLRSVRIVVGPAAVAGAVLLTPDWTALARDLAAPVAWAARAGVDGAAETLAGTALWAVCLWLGAGLAAAYLAALPGAAGHVAAAVARAVLPRALHGAVAGAAGLGVLLGPVLSQAAGVPQPGPSLPAPAWPTADLPAPSLPASGAPASGAPASDRPESSPRATPSPPSGKPGRSTPGREPQQQAATVVVEPGDSLWQIAARRLPAEAPPAQVTAAWPRWYAANRAVIGPDPNHITPGQVLRAPAGQEGP